MKTQERFATARGILMLVIMVYMLVPLQFELPHWPFWVAVFGILIVTHRVLVMVNEWRKSERLIHVILSAGMLSNLLAVSANGGRMPAGLITSAHRWWQPITPATRLYPLCDVVWGAVSIGDCIIVIGAAALLWKWVVDKYCAVEQAGVFIPSDSEGS